MTVGTQLSFDRMIRTIDDWAGAAPGREVFAQIGPSEFAPRHIDYAPFISPAECRARMVAADAIVAHAGAGTILSALELGKPLLVMPRRADLGEHRNDHQVATARRFAELGRVDVADDVAALARRLNEIDSLDERESISPHASSELLAGLAAFINR